MIKINVKLAKKFKVDLPVTCFPIVFQDSTLERWLLPLLIRKHPIHQNLKGGFSHHSSVCRRVPPAHAGTHKQIWLITAIHFIQ